MYHAICDYDGLALARNVAIETACVIGQRHADQSGHDVRIVSQFGRIACTIKPGTSRID